MYEGMPRSRVALAQALKSALATRPLSRVTVSELAQAAQVTRQTFYSHFANVIDLAEWVFNTEVTDKIMSKASYDDWADCFLALLTHMRNNRHEIFATDYSLDHATLANFYFGNFRDMAAIIVDEIGADVSLNPSDREFVLDHYAAIALGHLLHWLATDMAEEPFKLAANLEFILHGSVRESLERFAGR